MATSRFMSDRPGQSAIPPTTPNTPDKRLVERARRGILQRLRAARDPLGALSLASELGDARPSEIRLALEQLLAQGAVHDLAGGFTLSDEARRPAIFDELMRAEPVRSASPPLKQG